MGLLLDTNIISTHLKRPDLTFSKFVQHNGQLCTSQIVVAELYVWCWLSPNSIQRRQKVDAILTQAQPIAFDGECAWRFGELRGICPEFDLADLMIAATALTHDHIVVSHDGHFQSIAAKVSGLQIVDWLSGML